MWDFVVHFWFILTATAVFLHQTSELSFFVSSFPFFSFGGFFGLQVLFFFCFSCFGGRFRADFLKVSKDLLTLFYQVKKNTSAHGERPGPCFLLLLLVLLSSTLLSTLLSTSLSIVVISSLSILLIHAPCPFSPSSMSSIVLRNIPLVFPSPFPFCEFLDPLSMS